MNGTGVKRKIGDSIEGDETNFSQQCKALLNMTMCKIHMVPQTNRDVSLRRAVLMFNTLKDIENKLGNLGIHCPSVPTNLTSKLMIEGASCPQNVKDVSQAACHSPAVSSNKDASIPGCNSLNTSTGTNNCAIKSCDTLNQKTIDNNNSSSANLPNGVWSFLSGQDDHHTANKAYTAIHDCKVKLSESESSRLHEACLPPVTDTTDINMMEDIDLSIFDLDLAMPVSYGTTNSSATKNLGEANKVAPITEWSGTILPSPWSSNSGSCKKDVWSEELDRIMEILVGS